MGKVNKMFTTHERRGSRKDEGILLACEAGREKARAEDQKYGPRSGSYYGVDPAYR